MHGQKNIKKTGDDVSGSMKAQIKLKNVGMLLAVPVNYTACADYGSLTAY